MKRILFIIGLAMLILPVTGRAAQQSIFTQQWTDSQHAKQFGVPSQQLVDFVRSEFLQWHETGVQLTSEEVLAAVSGNLDCANTLDAGGIPLNLINTQGDIPGCGALMTDIQNLVHAETEANQLGADLLAITNGSELSIADEPHRPLRIPTTAQIIRNTWAGGGTVTIPWDPAYDAAFAQVNNLVTGCGSKFTDLAVTQFRHGYFRDRREADPRFGNSLETQNLKTALGNLATAMGITGDATASGDFAVPVLSAPNIGLWARKDDLGLMWIYPSRFTRVEYYPAGDFLWMVPGGETLAYPFEYQGSTIPSGPGITTPVCSRTVGRHGFLCAEVETEDPECGVASANAIVLAKCTQTVTTHVTPPVCEGLENIFLDTGVPLEDPAHPGELNPALTPLTEDEACEPGTRVIYRDDISSHACYTAYCIKKSMNEHTLIPGRNPTVFNEQTAPYLACVRPDPQVGRALELAPHPPIILPHYLGHTLMTDFDKAYCATFGAAPHPLAGFCSYYDDRLGQSKNANPLYTTFAVQQDRRDISQAQANITAIAVAAGQRLAGEQLVTAERRILVSLASFISQTAALLQDLERAPLTTTACPWTGPFNQ